MSNIREAIDFAHERLTTLGIRRVGPEGWRCPFCKKLSDNTSDALEHHDFSHPGQVFKKYRVAAGKQMWLYVIKGENEKGHKEFTAKGPEVSSKEVLYTDSDVCKTTEGQHPLGMFLLFLLPANPHGYAYVAFRVADVEVMD